MGRLTLVLLCFINTRADAGGISYERGPMVRDQRGKKKKTKNKLHASLNSAAVASVRVVVDLQARPSPGGGQDGAAQIFLCREVGEPSAAVPEHQHKRRTLHA